MGRRLLLPVWLSLCLLPLAVIAVRAEAPRSPAAQVEYFEKAVRPVLATNCFNCHGPDKQKGGLRLDSREALMKGGDSGPAVVPGKPEDSLLITAVHYDGTPQMPPKGKLKADQIAALTTWVKEGAAWPSTDVQVRPVPIGRGPEITAKDRAFWSFQPIADPPLPRVRDSAWPKTPLDFFVLARREGAGLTSVGPADKRTLIRRATFDLTGLP